MSVPNMLAKALYDNAAESPDELSFRKGDILTVLERDTQGLEGWWLCSLHGRQGIVPGNRLKVLVGMYDKQQQSPPSIAPNVLLVPQQGAYCKPHPSSQYTAMHPAPTPSLDSTYMLPPSHSKALPQDAYQVPTAAGGTNCDQDVYQTPSSSDNWNWTVPKPPVKVVVPTRVGRVYVYDTAKAQQDEYDVPRQFPSTQNIYDVPPTRNQKQQVYDTPSMAVKDTCRWDDAQDMYDTPTAVDKSHLQVYDVPPSVSKDTSESPGMGETYDVPPPFAKKKVIEDRLLQSHSSGPGTDPEEVYDVPPPLSAKRNVERSAPSGQEVYDIPTSTCAPGVAQPQTDVYDVPRECGAREEDSSNYVYDVPPQVVRDVAPVAPGPSEEPCAASGSTRSSASGLSLDMVPSRELPDARADLEPAMERLSHLQQAVESSVSLLVALLSAGCRGSERTETGAVGMRLAAERAQTAVRDLLEFARVPVASSAQASDRSLQAKLSRQLQKMEQAYEGLVRHSQALERAGWTLGSASTVADDLEQLLACLRGVPDDTKQLGSFLHGNASLLFRRTKQPQLTGGAVPAYQASGPERARIQSRPLPSPPKFRAEEGRLEGTYDTAEEGWMEDYDYVHLQGKEEFEKSQRQLLEKGNIIHHDKGQLEEQQLKQFERLEQEVTRPINNDPSGWTPPTECPAARSRLCLGDRQLLLFYLEQCESNVTALTNAVDAFFSSLGGNQPPKIFVAHSKFVILSAHKLVFIGDTLSRQAKSPEIRAQAAHHSATLCERLKDIVTSTKTAALQYPSPTAVRDTMDRVGELAACTQQFCLVLGQLATM